MRVFSLHNTQRQAIIAFGLFLFLVFLFLPNTMIGVTIFDEGFITSGAMLVGDGKLPYRDFLSLYGPGQYYLTAAIYSVFGEELQYMRILHAAILSALGISIYFVSIVSSKSIFLSLITIAGYSGIVLFAQPSVGYPAITATLFLLLSSLQIVKWVETLHPAPLVISSTLVGIAGLFRWDFGIFGLIAITVTTAITTTIEARQADVPRRTAFWLLIGNAPAILIMAATYAVMIFVLSDPVRWYQEVLVYSLTEFSQWREIEFVGPAVSGLLQSTNARAFGSYFMRLAYLAIPIFLIISAIGTAFHVFIRRNLLEKNTNIFVLTVYLAIISLLLLNQMRVRPHVWQGFAAITASLPLVPLLLHYHKDAIIKSRLLTFSINTVAISIGALLLGLSLSRISQSFDDRLIEFGTDRTNNIRVSKEMQPYIELVRYIESNTAPNEPIFSGVVDHSRLFVNDAILYFLTDRPPADRFLELEPGISNTQQGQEEIVDALKSKRVRLVVLSNIVGHEANNTSRSNGVTVLDEFIRANYHLARTFGNYTVFLKNMNSNDQ